MKELQCPKTNAPNNGGTSTLLLQAANSIVANHMRDCGYEYTLSTFMPEAGINLDKLLSPADIIHILHLPTGHPLSQIMTTPEQDKGLLMFLLKNISTIFECPVMSSIGVQTECDIKEDEEETELDSNERSSLEERILIIQRECEARSKRMLELEMNRFKQKELSMLRMEERNKYLKEISKTKEQLEQQYSDKVASSAKVLEEERGRLRRRESEMEGSLFSQRQALLEEMEALKMRERELKKEAELNKRAAGIEQEKTQSLQELMVSKEKLLNDLKIQYEEIAEAKVKKYETEVEKSQQIIAQLQTQLQAQQQTTSDLHKCCNDLVRKSEHQSDRENQLHKQLQDATKKQTDLIREKEIMKQQLPDCSFLTEKVQSLEIQLSQERTKNELEATELKSQIAEQHKVIKKLKAKPTGQSEEQQHGMEQILMRAKQETMAMQYDNRQLHKELTIKTEANLHLQQTFDEQTIQLRSAQREVHDLQEQVDHLHRVLLSGVAGHHSSGKKYHSPAKETSRLRSRRRSSPMKSISISSTTDLSPLPPLDSLLVPSPLSHEVSFSDTSAQLIAEARATFVRLEREAEELEKTYGQYQPLTSSSLPSTTSISHHQPFTTPNSHATSYLPSHSITPSSLSSTSTVISPFFVTKATVTIETQAISTVTKSTTHSTLQPVALAVTSGDLQLSRTIHPHQPYFSCGQSVQSSCDSYPLVSYTNMVPIVTNIPLQPPTTTHHEPIAVSSSVSLLVDTTSDTHHLSIHPSTNTTQPISNPVVTTSTCNLLSAVTAITPISTSASISFTTDSQYTSAIQQPVQPLNQPNKFLSLDSVLQSESHEVVPITSSTNEIEKLEELSKSQESEDKSMEESQTSISVRLPKTMAVDKQELSFEEWERERAKKKAQTEEQERLEREKVKNELQEMEHGDPGVWSEERIEEEREEVKDIMEEYMKIVRQKREQDQDQLETKSDILEKESYSLPTNSETTEQRSDLEDTNTFDEW